jgi:hypothetical protein
MRVPLTTTMRPRVAAKVGRIVRIVSVAGPRPGVLARTVVFLLARNSRTRRLRSLYDAPLPAATVELNLPVIDLPPATELPSELRESAELLRDEAEHVLAHRVDLLGSGLLFLGDELDWHQDFKSGYRWSPDFYQDVEVTRLDDASDAKVPWELSRCHHLLVLARAGRLFDDPRYTRELERQLASWLDANPPGFGVNWVNPMEVAIRAVNLVWILATLEGWYRIEPHLMERLVASLRWHGRHIRANLEGTPYLRSNHYLSDLLGLLTLGVALRGDPEAKAWFAFAQRELEREVMRQVHPDGVGFEASVAYHGLVLEILLIACYLADHARKPFSSRFRDRLRHMVYFSRDVRHGDGRIPLFGDQDSGRVLPAAFARPATHDNLIWWSSVVLGEPSALVGPPDAEVAWTFGAAAWRRAATAARSSRSGRSTFPDGGIYVLRSRRAHVAIRCGDVGQQGLGGHAHNDTLSYELSIDAIPFIVDAGTYAYTFDVTARNELRSTRSHNTVVIDGEEINPIDETRVFELRRFAHARMRSLDLNGETHHLECSHDGYRRLRPPVLHRRRYSLEQSTSALAVDDKLLGGGLHSFESFIHLAVGVIVAPCDDGGYDVTLREARARILFRCVETHELQVRTGWVSQHYGRRERAPVIVASCRRECPATFGYSITPYPD